MAAVFASTLGTVTYISLSLCFWPQSLAAGALLESAGLTFVVTAPFVLVGLIALGIPTSLALRRAHLENSVSYTLTGALAGTAFGAAVTGLYHAQAITAFAIYGVASALCWWWLRDAV